MISEVHGILVNGVLILNLLNNPLACWFLVNLYFLLQIAQFDTNILICKLFCLVLLVLKLLFTVFWLTTNTEYFHYFYTLYYIAFSRFFVSSLISLYSFNTFVETKFTITMSPLRPQNFNSV